MQLAGVSKPLCSCQVHLNLLFVFAPQARKQDLADRYLNSMAAKALFRADAIEAGEETAVMFTKDGDQINNLHDMQHMWYATHSGRAYLRLKDYGRALKKFTGVRGAGQGRGCVDSGNFGT